MKTLLVTLPTLLLTGCSSLYTVSAPEKQAESSDSLYRQELSVMERPVATPSAFQPGKFTTPSPDATGTSNHSPVTIQHYVRGLMQEMVVSMSNVTEQTPVAVASFVYLDTDLNQGSLLGNQIAESFVHELHNFGVLVVDFKMTGYLSVTPQGDFVHSRDVADLEGEMSAQYALGGTLSRHKDGILVNARMIEFGSKMVVASAQSLIPTHVIRALQPSLATNNMPLIKGTK